MKRTITTVTEHTSRLDTQRVAPEQAKTYDEAELDLLVEELPTFDFALMQGPRPTK